MSSRLEKPVFGFAFNVKVVSARVVRNRIQLLPSHSGYHVVLAVEGREEKTSRKNETELSWDEKFNLQGTNLSKLHISLIKTDKKLGKTVGDISIDMAKLVDYDGDTIQEVELTKNPKSKSESYVTITVSISKEASLAAKIYQSVVRAAEQAGAMEELSLSEGHLPSTDGVVMIDQDAWPLLMGRLSALVKIVDKVSEVHPYAKVAWDVTSVAYKLVREQIGSDARINQLIACIWEAYEFVEAAEPLNTVKTLQDNVQSLAHHTVEAAYFVRNYPKFSSFGTRILVSIASDVDSAIQQFEETFTKIRFALQQRIHLDAALTMRRITGRAKVEQIADDVASLVLNNMCFHRNARYDPKLSSSLTLPSKLVDLLAEWINCPNSDVPRLWLLTGSDRSHLSSIAATICKMFKKQNRLASSFFCRDDDKPTYPEHVIATIARNLADYDDSIKLKLYSSLRKDIAFCGTGVPEVQFEAFLAGPLTSFTGNWEKQVGPYVVVINSLDLCGDANSRERLVAVLLGRVHELPSNIRILVTSSPASDIVGIFKASSAIMGKSITGTRLVGNHCLQLVIEEIVNKSLSSMRDLYERIGSDLRPKIRRNMEMTLDLLSQLDTGLTYSGVVNDHSDRLLPPLRNINKFIEAISDHANREELTTIHGWFQPALQNLSVMVFLVVALNRNDLDGKEVEDITGRIDKLFNEACSFRPSTSDPSGSVLVHPLRLPDKPTARSCHPMFFDELTSQSPTRDDLIQSILNWTSDSVDENLARILLLTGGPGSGKTSIAHSVTRHFSNNGNLAWAFFHEICGKAECKEFLFSSMSKTLLGLSSPIYCPDSSHPAPTLADQLKLFLTTAVQYGKLGTAGSVVFVLDGLDQSFTTGTSSTNEFVAFLKNDVPRLPPNFRFLITWTSGAEDLISSLHPSPAVHLKLTCDGPVKMWMMGSKEAADVGNQVPMSDYAQEL